MAADDKTMRMVSNLDRKAIEGKLGEARGAAQSSNLSELAAMFSGVEGMPRAQIETRVANALKWLADTEASTKRVNMRSPDQKSLP